MTALLIFVLAAGAGAVVSRWWALLLPALLGVASALVLHFAGATDTPVVAVTLLAEAAFAAGVFMRRGGWQASSG